MTALPQSRVSQSLSNPLNQVARRQWSVLAARGIILTLIATPGLILIGLLILSVLTDLPLWGAVTAAVLDWATVLAAAIMFLRPALRRRSLVASAIYFERAMAAGKIDTHERITRSIEL